MMRQIRSRKRMLALVLTLALALAASIPVHAADGENGSWLKAVSGWKNITSVAVGYDYVAGLKKDGTVVVSSEREEFRAAAGWRGITRLAGTSELLAGLTGNGKILLAGCDPEYYKDVAAWKNIRDISVLNGAVAAVTDDGHVLCSASGFMGEAPQPLLDSWSGASSVRLVVSGAYWGILAFREDGTLLNDYRQYRDVSSSGWLTTGVRTDGSVNFWCMDRAFLQPWLTCWRDIRQVIASDTSAIGLKNDGTILLACKSSLREAEKWRDIERIWYLDPSDYAGQAPGAEFTALIGQKSDGTLLVTGAKAKLTGWKDITSFAAHGKYLIGLKSDGTVLTAECVPDLHSSSDEDLPYPEFETGWLTLPGAGSVYIPADFVNVGQTNAEDGTCAYAFVNERCGMALCVSEHNISFDSGVEVICGETEYWDSYAKQYIYSDSSGEYRYIDYAMQQSMKQYPGAECLLKGENEYILSVQNSRERIYLHCALLDGNLITMECRGSGHVTRSFDYAIAALETTFLSEPCFTGLF